MTRSAPAEDPTGPVLTQACVGVGLDPTGATVIRRGENTLYRLRDGTVARVTRPGRDRVAAAAREVAVAHWLDACGIPAVRAVGEEQPSVVDDGPARAVTFWRALPRHRHGTPGEVGGALRALHALPPPAKPELPPLDPFARLPERVSAAITLPAEDREWLSTHLDRLSTRYRRWLAEQRSSTRVVHGDAWVGNLVTTLDPTPEWSAGTTVLIDLERVSLGPPDWDLTSTAIKHTSFGWVTAADYAAFVRAYGADVTATTGFELLRDIRELRMTCYLAQSAAENPADTREAQLRVDCLRGRRGPRPWTWTAAA